LLHVKAEEEKNSTLLRRIWIRFQGASMGAYVLYGRIDATPETDSKTGKIVEIISFSALIP
jgi:hypothetical protein